MDANRGQVLMTIWKQLAMRFRSAVQVALCQALRVAYDLGHNHGNPAINTITPSPSILGKMRVLESPLSLRQLCNPFLGKVLIS